MEDIGYPEGRTVKIGTGETLIPESDNHLTELLQASINHEIEKRGLTVEPTAFDGTTPDKKRINRPHWKTLHDDMQAKAMAYRVWSVCGWSLFILTLIAELIIRVFV
jgi:hypothetical protein